MNKSSTQLLQSIIAKFHYTDPTGEDRTRPDKVRGLCLVLAKFHYTGSTGPARTCADPNDPDLRETPLVRVGLRQSPCGSAPVRAGPVGPM